MKNKKMYSAFISSVYESLLDERSEAINCMLDYRVFPVCMEHFTASATTRFNDITAFIDDCDVFVLILGKKYGSTDIDDISWTEKEYDYALSTNKPIIAIITSELSKILKLDDEEKQKLSLDTLNQIEFANKVSFARVQTETVTISKIISQFFGSCNFDSFAGWTRCKTAYDIQKENEEFAKDYPQFNLNGLWYHVHLTPDDPYYIRTGTITIKQNFTKEAYSNLYIEGKNYNVKYDAEKDVLKENILTYTHWSGDYKLKADGSIFGIFIAHRECVGTFGEVKIEKGIRRGIHDFSINLASNEAPTQFNGNFHDEAPSPKCGVILVFREKAERDEYIKDFCIEALTSK
ncbi:MAG: DUF4062 domain-containing protein [Clostridia bacterium]|nr:DUF4062 domain-containing protein [Clostridia bacterium]